MRQAPPVGVTCSGRGAWQAGGALLAALAAAAAAAWAAGHAGASPAFLIAAAAVAAGGAAALAWWRGAVAPRVLRWDGAAWRLGEQEGRVAVALDLGGWLLMRFQAPGARAHWLPLGAAEAGAAWHPLRCALHAAPAAPGGPSPEAA